MRESNKEIDKIDISLLLKQIGSLSDAITGLYDKVQIEFHFEDDRVQSPKGMEMILFLKHLRNKCDEITSKNILEEIEGICDKVEEIPHMLAYAGEYDPRFLKNVNDIDGGDDHGRRYVEALAAIGECLEDIGENMGWPTHEEEIEAVKDSIRYNITAIVTTLTGLGVAMLFDSNRVIPIEDKLTFMSGTFFAIAAFCAGKGVVTDLMNSVDVHEKDLSGYTMLMHINRELQQKEREQEL